MLITLLMIYLFIGFFGGNFGLKTSIAEDILNIKTPADSGSVNLGFLGGLWGLVGNTAFDSAFTFVDFIVSMALLPVTIILSDVNIIVKVVLEFISLMFYVFVAMYIRGTH